MTPNSAGEMTARDRLLTDLLTLAKTADTGERWMGDVAMRAHKALSPAPSAPPPHSQASEVVAMLHAALEALTSAVENMRVPQTISDAALQIEITLGPVVKAARRALSIIPLEPEFCTRCRVKADLVHGLCLECAETPAAMPSGEWQELIGRTLAHLENGQDHDEGAFDESCDTCLLTRDLRAALAAAPSAQGKA